MEVKQSYNGLTIYTGNHVDDELVDAVKKALDTADKVNVCFNVIGRTKHENLSYELVNKLGDKYDADIDYGLYRCEVWRVNK